MLWINEVEMVDSVDDFKPSRSIVGNHFPKFEMLDAKNCFCFEQDHAEFLLQEKGQSGGTESSERGSVPSRKTDRLHDLQVTGAHDAVLDCADLFSVTLRGQNRWNLNRFYGRVKKSWDQSDEYDSDKLRSVMITSEKAKVHRSEKFMSKILISAVRTPQNLRIGLRRRLKDKSDAPAETRGY